MKTWLLVTSTLNQSVQFKLCKVILATVLLTVSNAFAGFYPSSDFLGTNFNKQTNAANARTALAATGFQDVTNIVQSIATGGTNFPYTAITNSPWVLTNDFLSASNILQIQINANTSGLQFKTTTNGVNGILIASNFLQSIPVSATNQFATTNLVAASTNGLPSRIWTLGNLSQSNSINSNNISGSINIGQVFGAPTTNGFITSANGGNATLATNVVSNINITNPTVNFGSSVSLFAWGTNINGSELVVTNTNPASFAGFTAQANNGTFGTNYLFMGINNSAYVPSSTVVGTTNSGIIEMNGGDLYFDMIGATNRAILFGNRTSTNTAFAQFARLDGSNGLTLNNGKFSGDGSGLTNLPITGLTTNGGTNGQIATINAATGQVAWSNAPSGGSSAVNNSVTWFPIYNTGFSFLGSSVTPQPYGDGADSMTKGYILTTGASQGLGYQDCYGKFIGTNLITDITVYSTNAAGGYFMPIYSVLMNGTNFTSRFDSAFRLVNSFTCPSGTNTTHILFTNALNFYSTSAGSTYRPQLALPAGFSYTNATAFGISTFFYCSVTNQVWLLGVKCTFAP